MSGAPFRKVFALFLLFQHHVAIRDKLAVLFWFGIFLTHYLAYNCLYKLQLEICWWFSGSKLYEYCNSRTVISIEFDIKHIFSIDNV